MKNLKLTKIISSLVIVTLLSMLNPVGIYATEVINSVQTTDAVVNNDESDLTASSTTGAEVSENSINVTSVRIDQKNVVIYQGDKLTLKDTVLPSNATNKSVTWSSSNTDVAKVDASGEVKFTTYGNTIITCTANDGSGKYDTCKVTVYYPYSNKLNVLNKDKSAMELYSDANYDSDNIVNVVQNKKTYYTKTSSDSISVNIRRLNENYVKVFKATSYSVYGDVKTATLVDNEDISLSAGTTTLIIRVYNTKPDSRIRYKDDNDILNEYKVKVELNK